MTFPYGDVVYEHSVKPKLEFTRILWEGAVPIPYIF